MNTHSHNSSITTLSQACTHTQHQPCCLCLAALCSSKQAVTYCTFSAISDNTEQYHFNPQLNLGCNHLAVCMESNSSYWAEQAVPWMVLQGSLLWQTNSKSKPPLRLELPTWEMCSPHSNSRLVLGMHSHLCIPHGEFNYHLTAVRANLCHLVLHI